jgi:DNA-binding CsgD family transcriptional regulator
LSSVPSGDAAAAVATEAKELSMIGFNSNTRTIPSNKHDPRDLVQQQIRDIVSDLSRSTLRSGRRASGPAAVRYLAIGDERYRLVVDLLSPSDDADPVPVATVERVQTRGLSEQAVRDRYRLTRKETRVALLLAHRRSNAEIASELNISPHTARRHTENVMLKLNVSSRFSVETALDAVA